MKTTLKRSYRMWQRNVDVFKTYYIASIVGRILEPVLALFALGVGLGSLVGEINGLPYLEFLAPGVMAGASMSAAAFECTYGTYTRMIEQKVFDGILATPLSINEIVLGEIAWGATKAFISAFLMIVILILAGLFDSYFHIPLILLNMVLLGAATGAIAVAVSAVAGNYEFFNYFFTLFLTPMLLFTGIYFPTDQLPEWFANFFLIFPATHAVTINHFLFNGGDSLMPTVGTFYLLVFLFLSTSVSIRLVKRRMIPAD